MSEDSWLALALTPETGPAKAAQLLQHFGAADKIVAASGAKLKACGLSEASIRQLRTPAPERLAHAKRWLAEPHNHLIHWHDDRYPQLLKETGEAPPVLFVRGDPELLGLPQLAIVGSRSATAAGTTTAKEFASHLARAGLIITSGLAEGIDTAAHRGALHAKGVTIAVLGAGPDVIYPAKNQALADAICEHGALVSEFPPGMPVRKEHFPRRNRIISGLSLGALVVEAGMRSGSLITARLSTTYGREVFAVPGSIHSPVSKGCHRLIKQGAKLVENSSDIIEEIAAIAGAMKNAMSTATETSAPAPNARNHADPDYAKLLCSMSHDPVDMQMLIDNTGLTAGELSSMLLILELEGRVATLPGGRFQQLTGWNEPNE
jgi:DNA processing protein